MIVKVFCDLSSSLKLKVLKSEKFFSFVKNEERERYREKRQRGKRERDRKRKSSILVYHFLPHA